MELRVEAVQPVSDGCTKMDAKIFESAKQDTIDKLKEKIVELELELRKQKTAAEKGDKLLKVMWGDDFNDDSLH
jgi:hypothetical protein